MADDIKIGLSDNAREILRSMEAMPVWALQAIARGMKKEHAYTISHIQRQHLIGRGPFPPEQHRLGVRTNRLRNALWASDPVIAGERVQSAIGDNVVYAAVHEFGGRIVRKPYSGKVRLRTESSNYAHEVAGKKVSTKFHGLMRQKGHPNLAVFAGKHHKNAKEVAFSSEGYEINLPERAPIRTGIGERVDSYCATISAELVKSWEKGGKV